MPVKLTITLLLWLPEVPKIAFGTYSLWHSIQ